MADIDKIIDTFEAYMDKQELEDWERVQVAYGLLGNAIDTMLDYESEEDDPTDELDEIAAGLDTKAKDTDDIPSPDDFDIENEQEENIMPPSNKRGRPPVIKKPKVSLKDGAD